MSTDVLRVEHLYTGYEDNMYVKDLSFTLRKAELVGLIGLNGAGKSTTMKTIIGLLPKSSGKVTINGMTMEEEPLLVKKQLAYIPESPLLYNEMTLWEHLTFTAMGYKMSEEEFEIRVHTLLKKFRMEDVIHHFPSTFSKGMRQKIMILCAFLHDASLYLIDEPFIGLDPLAIQELIQLMKEECSAGKTILMNTHVLDSTEKICDRLLVLDHGRLLFDGTMETLRQKCETSETKTESFSLSEGFAKLVGSRWWGLPFIWISGFIVGYIILSWKLSNRFRSRMNTINN
ncbi:MAG: ABC transporter ATP-binding protein [Bacilli bacterium]